MGCKKINLIFLTFVFVLIYTVPLIVSAEDNLTELQGESVMGKLGKTAGPEGAGFWQAGLPIETGLPSYLGYIVRGALTMLGAIFFALMIYGGFLWLYAGGNEEQIKKAKTIITRAIIGFIVTIFAGGITQFILYYAGR